MISYTKKDYEHYLPIYLCDIQKIENLNKAMLTNDFPHHQLILCISGAGCFCSEYTIEQDIVKGDVVYVDSAMLFSIRPKSHDFSIYRIAFSGTYISNFLHYFGFEHISKIEIKNNDLDKFFNRMMVIIDNEIENQMELSTMLYDIVTYIGEYHYKKINKSVSPSEYFANKCYEYICTNVIMKKLDMTEFCKQNNTVYSKADKVFTRIYGISLEDMFFKYKMEFAKQAVFKVGNEKYKNYHIDCGFDTEEEFNKMFEEYTQMSIKEYIFLTWGEFIRSKHMMK